MDRLLAASAAAAIALLACRTPPVTPALPSHGGPKWIELSTAHFVVWTDDEPAHARKLVRTMERMRQIVNAIAFPDAKPTTRTVVVAFRNREELHVYVPRTVAALTFPLPNVLDQPAIVLSATALDDERALLTHELTHVVSYSVIHHQPRWFAEGLATYFETVRLDDSGSLDIGVGQPGRVQLLRRTRPLPIAELFACIELRCADQRFYATAWALFSYLVNEHPAELVLYMQRLADAPAATQTAQWTELFPQLAADALDRELARWLAHGRHVVKKYTAQFNDVPVAERALDDADIHATRGLANHLGHPTGAMVPEVTAALALDPTHVLSRVIANARGLGVSHELAERIAAAHPRNWRAWWLLASAFPASPTAADARAHLCELIAADPPASAGRLCPPTPPTPPEVTPP